MEKQKHYRPALGLIDLILAIGYDRGVDVKILSVGPGEKAGLVSTVVKLAIGPLPFEANLAGSWQERDRLLRSKLNDYLDGLKTANTPLESKSVFVTV